MTAGENLKDADYFCFLAARKPFLKLRIELKVLAGNIASDVSSFRTRFWQWCGWSFLTAWLLASWMKLTSAPLQLKISPAFSTKTDDTFLWLNVNAFNYLIGKTDRSSFLLAWGASECISLGFQSKVTTIYWRFISTGQVSNFWRCLNDATDHCTTTSLNNFINFERPESFTIYDIAVIL